jgi:excisionase family DNA binding protein
MSTVPPLLDRVEETARLIGASRSTVYRLLDAGELEAVHIGRAVRITRASTEQYVERLRAG